MKTESARQADILDCTLELVREGGLGGLTMKKIARRVGFSEPALYRHFPTKQALILGLMDRLEKMLLGTIRRIASDESLGVSERLERIVTHHTSIVRDQKGLPILLLAEASVSEDETLLKRMRKIFRAYLKTVESLLNLGHERGEIPADLDADCLAMILLGAPAALAIRCRLLPDAEVENRFEKTMVPFLLKALNSGRP